MTEMDFRSEFTVECDVTMQTYTQNPFNEIFAKFINIGKKWIRFFPHLFLPTHAQKP